MSQASGYILIDISHATAQLYYVATRLKSYATIIELRNSQLRDYTELTQRHVHDTCTQLHNYAIANLAILIRHEGPRMYTKTPILHRILHLATNAAVLSPLVHFGNLTSGIPLRPPACICQDILNT